MNIFTEITEIVILSETETVTTVNQFMVIQFVLCSELCKWVYTEIFFPHIFSSLKF